MTTERATSLLELLGMLLLTAAVAVGFGDRYGLIVGLAIAGLLCFGWSIVVGFSRRRGAET